MTAVLKAIENLSAVVAFSDVLISFQLLPVFYFYYFLLANTVLLLLLQKPPGYFSLSVLVLDVMELIFFLVSALFWI